MRTPIKSRPRDEPAFRDSDLARQAGRQLRSALAHARPRGNTLKIQIKTHPAATLTIPVTAAQVFSEVLEQMGQGQQVKTIPLHRELTTQAAADILQVSRPFLISQLEKGLISCRRVGSHRRVRLEDVLTLKKRLQSRRLKTLSKLSALDQKLGFI